VRLGTYARPDRMGGGDGETRRRSRAGGGGRFLRPYRPLNAAATVADGAPRGAVFLCASALRRLRRYRFFSHVGVDYAPGIPHSCIVA
jgi:hypothetical protein